MRVEKITCDKCGKDCPELMHRKSLTFGDSWSGIKLDACDDCYRKIMEDIKPFIPEPMKK